MEVAETCLDLLPSALLDSAQDGHDDIVEENELSPQWPEKGTFWPRSLSDCPFLPLIQE